MNLVFQAVLAVLSFTTVISHDEVYTLNGFLRWLDQFESSYVGPNTAYRSRASLREVAHGIRSLLPEYDDLRHKYLLFGVYGLVQDPKQLAGADKSVIPSNLYNQETLNSVSWQVRETIREILQFRVEKDGWSSFKAEGIIQVRYPGGTFDTVAPSYLIMGINAGLEYNRATNFNLESINNLVAMTIGELLVTSALRSRNGTQGDYVGPSGSWDDPSMPHKYTFDSDPTAATDAQIKGAIDGYLIGKKLSKMTKTSRDSYSLPAIIREYYEKEAQYRFYYFYQTMDRVELEDEVYRIARIDARVEACGTDGMYDLKIVECHQDDDKLKEAAETAVERFYDRYLSWSAPLEVAKG